MLAHVAPLLLLLALESTGQSPSKDLKCSLNGELNDRDECECRLPWGGASCNQLDMLPVDRSTHPGAAAYGYAPNVSSWGGTILEGDDGHFHLFVAQMKTGGLVGWGSQSECVHATSTHQDGPFLKSDVALTNECHGPVVIRDPTDGDWLMFHQGSGPHRTTTSPEGFMHHAPKPTGPWTPAKTAPANGCGMPTAAFHPNGTLFAICRNGHELVWAEGRDEPWKTVMPLSTPPQWEDPSLYFDIVGNWHIVYHVYALQPFASGNERYSGHAYSVDGLNWTFSGTDEPFGGTVQYSDGTNKTFSTRERPQLIFAGGDRTTPIGLTSSVSPQPIGPWCDICKEGACSQCKVTPGRDWTYTIFQRFKAKTEAYRHSIVT